MIVYIGRGTDTCWNGYSSVDDAERARRLWLTSFPDAAWVGREARPALSSGICGENVGDPGSIDFFHRAGLA